MSKLGSSSHTIVDIDEDILAYKSDAEFEADLDIEWYEYEVAQLYYLFDASKKLPESSGPLLNEEILREQERDEFFKQLRYFVVIFETSVYIEDQEDGLMCSITVNYSLTLANIRMTSVSRHSAGYPRARLHAQ